MKRIDNGIAGQKDCALILSFSFQGLCCKRSGYEMISCQDANQLAVYFLRERTVVISGAQPGLNVSERDLMVEGRQTGDHCGCGVTLNQNDVWFQTLQYVVQRYHGTRGQRCQTLILLHQVEIDVRFNGEYTQYLIQHLTMLPRNAYD